MWFGFSVALHLCRADTNTHTIVPGNVWSVSNIFLSSPMWRRQIDGQQRLKGDVKQKVEPLFCRVFDELYSVAHFVISSGTGETSNYLNTPLGTAVCCSSPHLFWDHKRCDKILPNRLEWQIWDFISGLCHRFYLTSNADVASVFVTQFQDGYFLI